MRPSSTILVTSLLTAQTLAFAIPNPFAKRYTTAASGSSSGEYSYSGGSTQDFGSYEQASQTNNNGEWQPSATAEYGSYGEGSSSQESWQEGATGTIHTYPTATESEAEGVYPTSEPYAITSAPVETSVAAQATGTADWETQVTWPAGCESWANPCPAGAHISGGSVAGGSTNTAEESGYTNAFTSLTSMTNSVGIITGMPSKATVAAGVTSSAGSTLQTLAVSNSQSAQSSIVTPTGSSGTATTSSEFSVNTASSSVHATFETGAAVPKKATFGGAALVGAAGAMVALL